MKAERRKYDNNLKGKIAEFFQMKNSETETFLIEICGGLTMYLVSVYILLFNQGLQGTRAEATGLKGTFSKTEYDALPYSAALATGLATILMGILGKMPLVVAPAISYSRDFRTIVLAMQSWQGALGANMIIGGLLVVIAATAVYTKPISSIPEDFRLGLAGGIGAYLCLIGFRNSFIVTGTGALVNVWDYRVLLAMVGIMLIVIIENRGSSVVARYSYVISILVVTILSLIVRASMDKLVISPLGAEATVGSLAGHVSTAGWSGNEYSLLKYIVTVTLTKYVNNIGTVTAVVLAACMTRLGYNKNIFHETLKESKKLTMVYLADGIANVLIAPLLGCTVLTPFIQSVAGVVVGARTGFSSVVCGLLFLISTPFAVQIGQILPNEATGPALVINCFAVIKCVRHIDETSVVKMIPAYMVFVLIPFTNSMGGGFAFSYLILFTTWLTSDMWTSITPQMIFAFSSMILLCLLLTNSLTTTTQVSIAIGVFIGGGAIAAIIASQCCVNLQTRFGVHVTNDSEENSTRIKSVKQTNKNPKLAVQHQSAKSNQNSSSNHAQIQPAFGNDTANVATSQVGQTVVEVNTGDDLTPNLRRDVEASSFDQNEAS